MVRRSSNAASSRGSRTKRILWVAVLAGAAAGSGALYQVVETARDRKRYPAPGRLVDAGGHGLHLDVKGEDKKGPTVVLEMGEAGASPLFARLHPAIAEFARVVNYDRAGIGWSEPGPKPRDAYTIARELHTALKNAGLPAPYIPVGASMGGPFALVFAGLYPEETAGVVLVDSMHPDQWERLPSRMGRIIRMADKLMPLLPLLARFGLLRLLDTTRQINMGLSEEQRLTPQAQTQLRAVFALSEQWKASHAETTVWDVTREQMRASWNLREKPLLVLSATRNETFPDMMGPWLEMQAELASLSSDSRHHLMQGASHVALITDPRYLREVAENIREFLEDISPAKKGARRDRSLDEGERIVAIPKKKDPGFSPG